MDLKRLRARLARLGATMAPALAVPQNIEIHWVEAATEGHPRRTVARTLLVFGKAAVDERAAEYGADRATVIRWEPEATGEVAQ